MKTLAAMIFCLLLLPWMGQSAEYYRWIDENGVSHITDQPPPETGKKVKTYRFQPPTKQIAPESQTPGGITEGQSEGVQPPVVEHGQDINPELEQARVDYEEAKSHEAEIQFNYKQAYGSSWDRKFWRNKLEDIEKKRQRVENLEKGINTGEDTSLPSTSENSEER